MGVHRANVTKLTAIGGTLSLLTILYLYSGSSLGRFSPPSSSDSLFPERLRSTCPPDAYASGQWTYNPRIPPHENATLKSPEDFWAFSGLDGCTSDREFYWHLGVDTDPEPHNERFEDGVMDYEWTPGEGCDAMRPMNAQSLVRDFVANGGWLILGDSISENHFFSLSCSLYPHVRSTPNYTENPYFDRAWPQNLYLNPSSPLIDTLNFPLGFSIESTPLVTFRRIDLLMAKEEIEKVHKEAHPHFYEEEYWREPKPYVNEDGMQGEEQRKFELFSEEQIWTMSPKEYMEIFTSPLPIARYSTLIVSTAGHWTTHLFTGIREENDEINGFGIQSVLGLFEDSMSVWAKEVQNALDEDRKEQERRHKNGKGETLVNRQVVVRAYLSGHEDCHEKKAPWTEVVPYQFKWWNWPWIRDFNEIFQSILMDKHRYPDIHFLPLDRPGMLRPDAHVTSDCLHLMTGTGVIEGWTHYIWHFVTRELPGRIR